MYVHLCMYVCICTCTCVSVCVHAAFYITYFTENMKLVKAVLCAGLYPNVANITPGKRFISPLSFSPYYVLLLYLPHSYPPPPSFLSSSSHSNSFPLPHTSILLLFPLIPIQLSSSSSSFPLIPILLLFLLLLLLLLLFPSFLSSSSSFLSSLSEQPNSILNKMARLNSIQSQ